MTTVTFYRSAICPRCKLASLYLSRLLRDFPDVELKEVEYLTRLGAAREEGVRRVPTLKSGDRQLSGFLLGKKRIRQFLESL